MILLDTHVIVWLVTVDRRLGKAATATILAYADAGHLQAIDARR